ncbi:hypothetical protein GCM10010987_63460 [Bradyrhizobium guangdongense]|uniref:Chorismate-utilising enzyme C-terminal domain-containing protein n=1 Tax=Bradyrhizobium guangdongense TaxID=1325090 RepID=A0AA88BBD9_9BRAD|nr:hypothetical protein GCM10010987_63460 [Bradyrhizobium guangdongense]
MEIIAEIERVAREVYCGAIGFNGHMDTNIAIRTVTIDDDLAVFHAGGGITVLSDPEAESRRRSPRLSGSLMHFVLKQLVHFDCHH